MGSDRKSPVLQRPGTARAWSSRAQRPYGPSRSPLATVWPPAVAACKFSLSYQRCTVLPQTVAARFQTGAIM